MWTHNSRGVLAVFRAKNVDASEPCQLTSGIDSASVLHFIGDFYCSSRQTASRRRTRPASRPLSALRPQRMRNKQLGRRGGRSLPISSKALQLRNSTSDGQATVQTDLTSSARGASVSLALSVDSHVAPSRSSVAGSAYAAACRRSDPTLPRSRSAPPALPGINASVRPVTDSPRESSAPQQSHCALLILALLHQYKSSSGRSAGLSTP